jgi:hypothetical protein
MTFGTTLVQACSQRPKLKTSYFCDLGDEGYLK